MWDSKKDVNWLLKKNSQFTWDAVATLPFLSTLAEEISPEMRSKNTLLLFLLLRYNSTGEQDSCSDSKESFGTPFQNRALVGYIIKSFLTQGILSCSHKCLPLSSCSSYNYQASATQGGVCELNGGNVNIRQNLVKRHGFVFVLVQRKVKVTGILYSKTIASILLVLPQKPAKLSEKRISSDISPTLTSRQFSNIH